MAGTHGGARPGAGRKPVRDEQLIKDLISPYRDEVIAVVIDILKNAEKDADRLSAAKLMLAYDFGTPQAHIDHTTKGEKINIPISKWVEENE